MENMRKYAKLIVVKGLNIQVNQNLVINSPIETADFTRLVMEEAYAVGAREVIIRWNDDASTRIKMINDHDSVYDAFPSWITEFYNTYSNLDTAYLSISASDPSALDGVDSSRLMKLQMLSSNALKFHREKTMANELSWCVISVPTVSWAKKVFPNETSNKAVEKLWDMIYFATRVNEEDPIKAWEKHLNDLVLRRNFLNEANFKSLHYTNNLGTDLHVGLVENHIWAGGSENTTAGYEFVANMPTEEVFTMPSSFNVNGRVYSSLPLCHNGNIIDEFWLEFKEGKVVDYDAKVGKQFLTDLIMIDDGSARLGEVALVQNDSPISNLNTLFYNTLYDENASCHFAFGKAYPINIQDSTILSKEELMQRGMNDSMIHVDFMVGTKDLKIVGIKQDGCEVTVMENGNFVI